MIEQHKRPAHNPIGKRRKFADRDLRQFPEAPRVFFLANKSQGVSFRRNNYPTRHAVPAQLPMVDLDPLDVVPESLAGATVFFEIANPSPNRLEGRSQCFRFGPAHTKPEWKKRFASDRRCEDSAPRPQAQDLITQVTGR